MGCIPGSTWRHLWGEGGPFKHPVVGPEKIFFDVFWFRPLGDPFWDTLLAPIGPILDPFWTHFGSKLLPFGHFG